jgi:hypothetical protein
MPNFEITSQYNAAELADLVVTGNGTAFYKVRNLEHQSYFEDVRDGSGHRVEDINLDNAQVGDKLVNRSCTFWSDTEFPNYYSMVALISGDVVKGVYQYGEVVHSVDNGEVEWVDFEDSGEQEDQPLYWCFYRDYVKELNKAERAFMIAKAVKLLQKFNNLATEDDVRFLMTANFRRANACGYDSETMFVIRKMFNTHQFKELPECPK